MGHCAHAARHSDFVQLVLCPEVLTWCVRMTFTALSTFRLTELIAGMFESCVAPLLILVISMFYKKDEQVGGFPSHRTKWQLHTHTHVLVGFPYLMVLRDGMAYFYCFVLIEH